MFLKFLFMLIALAFVFALKINISLIPESNGVVTEAAKGKELNMIRKREDTG